MSRTSTSVATREPAANVPAASVSKNFFEQYGEQASSRSTIVGQLLKFNKGDWLLGQDEEELPDGTRYVINMNQLMVGWVRWSDNKPVEQVMGLVVEGYQAPKRDTLGYDDKETWETFTDGQPKDPWQFSNQVVGKPVGKPFDHDTAVTFVTSSRGGIGAVGELCKRYGKEMRTHDGQNPIVELGSDSYKHPNPEFGRIKVPTLTIVGWEKGALFDVEAANEEAERRAAAKEASEGKKASAGKEKAAVGGKRR